MSQVEIEDLGSGKFAVHGDLTFETVGRALELSREMFADHASIEVDLAGIGEGDSAGLALLLEWVNWAKNFVREIRYVNVPNDITAMAQISEVDTMLTRGERWTGVI